MSECVEEDESEAEEDQKRIQQDLEIKSKINGEAESEDKAECKDDAEKQEQQQQQQQETRKHKFVVTKAATINPEIEKELTKFTAKINSKTVHFPCTAPTSRPMAKNIFGTVSPHLDKRFFDSSLVEIRQTISDSASTLDGWKSDQDLGIMDDVWIKRDKVGIYFILLVMVSIILL